MKRLLIFTFSLFASLFFNWLGVLVIGIIMAGLFGGSMRMEMLSVMEHFQKNHKGELICQKNIKAYQNIMLN